MPHLYLSPRRGVTSSGFREDVLMLVKLEWLGYRMVKKLWQYVKPFSSDIGTLRTDGQTDGRTDRIAISISRVSVLMRDKNYKTNHDENSGQYWDLKNVFFNAIVWRHSKFKIMDGRHIENRFFGHNSAADCPVSLKFCMEKQNSMTLQITSHKSQILKIQYGALPPFWKSLIKTPYLR